MYSYSDTHTLPKETTGTVTILDENKIELAASYEVKNGELELTYVELVIAGTGVNILPLLNHHQRHFILNEIELNF